MRNFFQFCKFAIVGVSNTLISEVVYGVLVYLDVPYLMAYFAGFCLSVINAYYWSNRYVFKTQNGMQRVWWKTLLKTYVAYLWSFLLSAMLLILWIDVVHISRYMNGVLQLLQGQGVRNVDVEFLGEITAAAINLLITVPMNFFVNKFWAYKN